MLLLEKQQNSSYIKKPDLIQVRLAVLSQIFRIRLLSVRLLLFKQRTKRLIQRFGGSDSNF